MFTNKKKEKTMKKLLALFVVGFLKIWQRLSFIHHHKLMFTALQNQTGFDEGTFTFDGVSFGIIDITLGEESSEIDVSDTETESGESEYLAGKTNRSISFTGFHKVGQQTLPAKVDKDFSLVALDESGGTTTFSGTCKILSKEISGSRDGALQVAYSGRIQGAMDEDHSS